MKTLSDPRVLIILIAFTFYGIFARTSVNGNLDLRKEPNNQKRGTSMLAEIAKEMIQRSTTSQVLNLNLSNLLLLLVLKAVVFGAGYFGHHGYDKSRNLDEENVVSDGEVTLALGYLIGDSCFYRAACEEPKTASEYLGAAEMILQTMKLLPQNESIDRQYGKTIAEFRKAIEYGMREQCPPEYTCKKENINNLFGGKHRLDEKASNQTL